MKNLLAALGLCFGLGTSALAQTPAAAPDWRQQFRQITFGVASGENQQEGNLRWAPMAPYLQQCLGIERVTIRVSNDYSAMIEAMAQGDVHLAWYGPAQYAILSDLTRGDVVPVAVDVSPQGDMGYRWVIIVRADSPIRTLEDLRGKSVGWATPTSTSGYVLPMQYFRERGWVDERGQSSFFGRLVQTGSHDNGMVSVAQGRLDATTGWYYSPQAGAHVRAAGAGTIKLEDIRFIHESGLIPNAPFTTRRSYPEPMRAKMSECLVNMRYTAPEAWATVSRNVFGGIGLVSHEAYEPFIALRQAERRRR
ncbi:phosphate/phosphite/phosphonate ABC transporter substrate-binding protein [Falsiroseomonas selenitidurans]|uniref:Phosphate/phosphite/phosphonate ABC transporter substrate-binding protein n=1 Tax=Falsiroseomonas selenitidurans TaxID=2716335 RepID=A0ABX1DXP5_9PROT|nr:phosphate/phosphite/phosphonate ABC transporter substrate-binding protein [Falsiroseomonas selenitidurans]NKC29687.1 phosphate/phosphite/phosphonate ABC transporter substrate-binding protein [Falsiroseomonas selenitidurans]